MASYNHSQSQSADHSSPGFYGVSVSWSDLQQIDTENLWERLQEKNSASTFLPQGAVVFFCERSAALDGSHINHRFEKTREAFCVGSTIEFYAYSTQDCIFYGTNGSRVRLTHTETGTSNFELIESGEVVESHNSNVLLLAPPDEQLIEEFGLESEYIASTI